MKIRIFALAKELGMDSKVLIDECNQAGVKLKNSALASITPEERDIVIEYLNKNKQPSDSPSADVEDQATLTPQREQTKLRTIKAMTSRSQPSRSVSQKSVSKEKNTEERSSQQEDKPSVETHETEEEPETAVVEGASSELDQPEDAQARPDSIQRMAGGRSSKEDNGEGDDQALSRDDYVPAGGAAPSSTIREMKPRGSTRSGKQQSKAKSKSALPTVAAPPAYKQPVIPKAKKKEEKAQKPEVRLTADILEQKSPLAAHLAQHTEQKKRDKDRDPQDEDSKQRRGSISLVEARKQRREQRKEGRRVFAPDGTEQQETVGRRPRRTKRKQDSSNIVHKTEAEVELPITVRSLSEAMGRPAKAIMSIMFKEFGEMVTINQIIEEETALAVALELGVDLTFKRQKGIEETVNEIIEQEDASEDLITRPPIITVLGHVDHGKTTLVDSLRNSKVVEGEAGGITQHIAAYQVEHNNHKLTFVDTPGHAAFSEMRSRGANVTDMVVLVVAADDGVMPQTAESISHVKASGVPMVVAMNKIDLPEINEQKVLTDLAAQDVLPSEWGGETEVVRVSALNGTGLDNLLETLLLTAELHELKANPNRPAVGVCLEGFRDEGRGSVAWLIVQKGTLRIGDAVVCGKSYGYIRAMYDDRDQQLEEAPPSLPVKVTGLDSVPGAGDHFAVLSDIEQARELAEERRHEGRTDTLARHSGGPRTLDDIMGSVREGEIEDLSLIIKADTPGSLEAIRSEISKFEHPEVRVKILHEGVGGVNESDVYLATASDAIIIAFHVVAEDRAKNLAVQEGVEIRRYSIIYEVVDDIRQSLEGLLRPELVQEQTGRALVLQTFSISRFGKIAGCRVLNGTINRNDRVHVIRDQKILNQYPIASLKREKDDTKEVREGMECGILLAGFNDIKEGDLLEAFRINEVKRTLDSTS
ncbi:translation initiation factor IF-2 [Gimesia aquarii]|uniref:Translation initiation factor IF-2 n=1 Tax=Gimesia aquarii TaxID=2527964 RepID=A0A517X2B4_9PLAN|nr:translation initiation factor IF-2 [Gimesia aquarii]QDU11653.1 Translation initiation factor IF-2 [Gimesia aquarii]